MSDWIEKAAAAIVGKRLRVNRHIEDEIRKRFAASFGDFVSQFVEWRGIENPCSKCGGRGTRAYSNTATWRGGIGGQMITSGVCDHCWGSGDADNKWPSRRTTKRIPDVLTEWETRLRGGLSVGEMHSLQEDLEGNSE